MHSSSSKTRRTRLGEFSRGSGVFSRITGTLACSLALVILSFGPARSEVTDKQRLYMVKGAFIFYLSKYVAWPASRHVAPVTPFIFCVVDNTELYDNLNVAMQSRTIRGQRIIVKSLLSDRIASNPQVACDIIYFEHTSSGVRSFLKTIATSPILTIGTSEDFLKSGGAIYLFERDNKMHFTVNIEALTRSQLQLTSDMFDLADSIVKYDAETSNNPNSEEGGKAKER